MKNIEYQIPHFASNGFSNLTTGIFGTVSFIIGEPVE
jgi:hypothetical protein